MTLRILKSILVLLCIILIPYLVFGIVEHYTPMTVEINPKMYTIGRWFGGLIMLAFCGFFIFCCIAVIIIVGCLILTIAKLVVFYGVLFINWIKYGD